MYYILDVQHKKTHESVLCIHLKISLIVHYTFEISLTLYEIKYDCYNYVY